MPTEMTEHKSESRSIDAPATGRAGAALDRDAKSPRTDPASKPVPPGAQRSTRRRKLLLGVLGVLVLAAALWFGIPYILLTLSTVSTDDAGSVCGSSAPSGLPVGGASIECGSPLCSVVSVGIGQSSDSPRVR